MERGRPKNQIPRNESLHLRLTKFELDEISRLAKKLKISRTETILRAINLLKNHKPKKFANVKEILKKRGVDTSDINL